MVRWRSGTTAIVVALVLAGCGGPGRDAAPTGRPGTAAPAPLPTVGAWPLTGVPGDVVDRAAVSVKVENSAQARPQTGLEDADLVWEEMVEGGITRFNAVFHSRLPEAVGPIRSLRPMDVGISGPLGGVLAISGGRPEFVAEARRAGLQLVVDDEGDAGFFRSSARRSPHNLYGSPEVFLAAVDDRHQSAPEPQFVVAGTAAGASAVSAGSPASRIALRFPASTPSWTWHDGKGRWQRGEAGEPARTADGAVLAADNVVVLRVEVRSTGAVDSSGAPVPETVMVGRGEAVVAGGGRTLPATWSKDDVGEPVVLRDAAGKEVALLPGTTWIELVPVDGGAVTVTP